MIEMVNAKFKKMVKEETQYFLDHPEKVDLRNVDGAAARCYGALTLTTSVLFDLGQAELAAELGQHWDEIDRPALYDILYNTFWE